MNYYYDVMLNFMEDNYLFYEWDELDNIEYFKKVPFFHISSKVLEDFINNNITINKDFLNLIKDKKSGNYIALFSDKNGSIALEFNESGESINRSFLRLEDEININDILYTVPLSKIEYKKGSIIKYNGSLRIEDKIKLLINTEINSMFKKNEYLKLRYLFAEWFNKDSKNIEEMVKLMQNKLKEEITSKEIYIYNLIKLSYSRV